MIHLGCQALLTSLQASDVFIEGVSCGGGGSCNDWFCEGSNVGGSGGGSNVRGGDCVGPA